MTAKRQKTVSLRLSDEEVAEIQNEAEQTGVSVSTLLRRRALAQPDTPPARLPPTPTLDQGGPDVQVVVYHVDQLGPDPLRMPGGGSLAR